MTKMVQRAYARAIEQAPLLAAVVAKGDAKGADATAKKNTEEDSNVDNPHVNSLHIDPSLDPQVQLIRFFSVFPGLKRQIGGWIVRYYAGSVPKPPDP